MYDYNARYYDPYLSRFIQADTIVPDHRNPQLLNRYSYAGNNPIRYNDPDGHCGPLCWAGIVLGLTGVALSVNASQPLPPERQPSDVQGFLGVGLLFAGLGLQIPEWLVPLACGDGNCTNEAEQVANAACGGDCGDEIYNATQATSELGERLGDFVKTGDVDPYADALAQKLGGQSSVTLSTDPLRREIDAVSREFIGQVTSRTNLGSSFRNQAKATFEIASTTGRKVYYQFLASPSQAMIDKLYEYAARYNVELVIEIVE